MVDPKKMAAQIIADLGTKKIPVPIEKIARKLGAVIIKRSDFDDDLCGMIVKEDDLNIIGVNETHHENRQRFTIAHEIGHLVLHSDIINKVHIDKTFNQALKRDGRSKIGQDKMEIEANRFAAELLMPTAYLKDELKEGYIDIESGVETLAKKYGVSTQAMSIKLLDILPLDKI